LLVYYEGHFYFPILHNYPERAFGGDIPMFADYQDPFIRHQLAAPGNFVIYAPNHYSPNTVAYFAAGDHHPGAPNHDTWLGTDSVGYDITAQLLVGFKVSVTFAFALTIVETLVGIFFGALQGYFAGTVDLVTQRFIEVWSALPELFLLLIFAAIFNVTFMLLFIIMAVFGWVHVSYYVRAEFLRNRQLEYVKSARALGLSSWQIITRHILPNSITPVITLLPFRLSASIIALASLDFLGLGVARTPSLGNLLLQGKQNLDAWWISVSAIGALVLTLLLLNFIGEALRAAMSTLEIKAQAGGEEA
jgi:microcin C transport system permease protein